VIVRSPIQLIMSPDGNMDGRTSKVSQVYQEYISFMDNYDDPDNDDQFIVHLNVSAEGAELISADSDYEVLES
jgi:hypothetical protein